MSRKQFFTIIFFIFLVFIFIKIYQNNLVVKLNYQKQRYEKNNNKLRKQKNELLVTYFKLKDQHRVKNIAQNNLEMNPIKFSQIEKFNKKG